MPLTPNCRTPRGVTLVEMIVVLAVIAAASLFLIPWFQSRQILSNEAAARAALREVAAAEGRFLAANGGTTFGLMGELLGATERPGLVTQPAAMNLAQGQRRGMFWTTSGYIIALRLPGNARTAVCDDAWVNVDPKASGKGWLAVAWPATVGYSGRMVYVIDATGVLRQYRNETPPLITGTDAMPPEAFGVTTADRPMAPPTGWARTAPFETAPDS